MNAHVPVQDDTMTTNENKEKLNCEEDMALYHHEYRKELLTQALMAVGAAYDYEPSCRSTPLDVTAVHEDQLSWGRDIKHRPGELLSFHLPTAEKLSKKEIGSLKYDDKLPIDFRGKPFTDFPSLPLVISSEVEGWRVEAWMRSDGRMELTDIVARIPVELAIDPAGHRTPMPIYQSGTLRERARNFRNNAGLISWKSQGKDPKIEKFMDDLRSPAEKANNQTIGRDLTSLETGSLGSLNLGTRPDRAQVRQDPEATQKYRDKMLKRADLTSDF